MKLNNVLVVHYRKDYCDAFATVKKALEANSISYHHIHRDRLNESHFKGSDLVITVGGDGTFLMASHYVKDKLMFGVCSDVNKNEGFLLNANKKDFSRKLSLILKNKFKIKKLMRLEASIDGKKTRLALNELFIGCGRSYQTARQIVKIKGREERQLNSGIIIATPSGSTAWIKSAGGKKLARNSKNFQYLVREPYFGRLTKPKLIKGILSSKDTITVKSLTYKGVVAIDSSMNDYSIKENAVVKVKVSKNPLRIVSF